MAELTVGRDRRPPGEGRDRGATFTIVMTAVGQAGTVTGIRNHLLTLILGGDRGAVELDQAIRNATDHEVFGIAGVVDVTVIAGHGQTELGIGVEMLAVATGGDRCTNPVAVTGGAGRNILIPVNRVAIRGRVMTEGITAGVAAVIDGGAVDPGRTCAGIVCRVRNRNGDTVRIEEILAAGLEGFRVADQSGRINVFCGSVCQRMRTGGINRPVTGRTSHASGDMLAVIATGRRIAMTR